MVFFACIQIGQSFAVLFDSVYSTVADKQKKQQHGGNANSQENIFKNQVSVRQLGEGFAGVGWIEHLLTIIQVSK